MESYHSLNNKDIIFKTWNKQLYVYVYISIIEIDLYFLGHLINKIGEEILKVLSVITNIHFTLCNRNLTTVLRLRLVYKTKEDIG